MTIRSDLRRQLAELAEAVGSSVGVAPLVASARQVGEFGESRPPGLYYDGPRRVPVLVYDGEFPDDATLRRYFPHGQIPMFVGGEADVVALVGG